ncbi:unnamed protein product, partial [Mesorhabditis spiculigera]
MSTYKLTYFPLRARAEVARQLFALAGQKFEDVRVPFEDWPKVKPETPYGQLPVLEVDGKTLAQSVTIARFLARRFGYYGADEFEAAQIDEFADAMNDYFMEQKNFFPVLIGKQVGDKDRLSQELFEPARDKFFPIVIERFLQKSKSGFLVGEKLSYIDLVLAEHVDRYGHFLPHAWDHYPQLKQHRDKIQAIPAIKKWLETRPDDAF